MFSLFPFQGSPVKKQRQVKPKNSTCNPSADLKLLPLIEDFPCQPLVSMDTDSQNSVNSIKSISSVSSTASLPRPDFVLKPGEFDVVLCIDNREFYGGG